MNLTDRMEFQKIKQKWGNGENLTDTEICMLFAWIENMNSELKIIKLQTSSIYGKMGDKK
jgi:hypothetical protein